ncbi:envelope stress response membrane protein PspC [Mixta tenebrionis]|uniref:Envelope stress response membrane protein PspC n=1 Tax=Mixta tenebrionis TaxID=2562439 RepID=A0A506VB94_9GAMM|nr:MULTISPECIES: envelope stress response membrane protein PspC [Mixta]QHM75414.1 Phage shock protein C [Mixta theicola]TPW43304.1 envelope stress response membrane protein PspC [Mixta tenebrionis]
MSNSRFSGKKLWRIPQQGKIKGVCAGIAHYLDIPVTLVRVMVVLSMVFGLFMLTLAAYIILSFVLTPMPAYVEEEAPPPRADELLNAVSQEMAQNESKLRQLERYVTSETFSVRSRFRQL